MFSISDAGLLRIRRECDLDTAQADGCNSWALSIASWKGFWMQNPLLDPRVMGINNCDGLHPVILAAICSCAVQLHGHGDLLSGSAELGELRVVYPKPGGTANTGESGLNLSNECKLAHACRRCPGTPTMRIHVHA